MGKDSYDFTQGPTTVSGTAAYLYDNPTFSYQDRTRYAEQAVDTPPQVPTQPQREMNKFTEIHSSRLDYLKVAFLIGFPLVFFIIGIVITSQNV